MTVSAMVASPRNCCARKTGLVAVKRRDVVRRAAMVEWRVWMLRSQL